MKISTNIFILLITLSLILISSINCLEVAPNGMEDDLKKDEALKLDNSEQTQQDTPGSSPEPGNIFHDIHGNKIDYSNPALYLKTGNQSELEEQYIKEISNQLNIISKDIKNIGVIFKWKQNHFKTYSAGGKFIGKITVNQIMEENALSGCHDHGLILVSVLRKYEFPAIMVDAAGIQWALDFAEGKQNGFKGHIFIEVYVKDRWILIDSTSGEYIENYNPLNSVIPLTDQGEGKGYFALFKGLDPEDYGINSNKQLTEYLKQFAGKIESIELTFPLYTIKRLIK